MIYYSKSTTYMNNVRFRQLSLMKIVLWIWGDSKVVAVGWHCGSVRFLCQDVGFSLWSSIFVSSLEEGKRSHTHSIIIKVFKLASVQPLGALSHSAPHARGALFSSRRESITKLQGLRKTSRRAYCSPHFRPSALSSGRFSRCTSAPKLIIPFDTLKLC